MNPEQAKMSGHVEKFYGHCRECKFYNTCNIAPLPEKGCCNFTEYFK